MLGRFVLLGVLSSIGPAAFAASPVPESSAPQPAERVRVKCAGTMISAGQPPPGSQVLVDGMIDFAARRVRGFGVGSQPIVVLTASAISFGSFPPDAAWHGNGVEGVIDRGTGETRVRVHSFEDPSEILIELGLDCEFERPVS